MSAQGSCIFCRIVEQRAEASLVYQDADITAFMDLFPITPGHTLIVPNAHKPDLASLGDELGGRMIYLARRLANAARRSELACQAVTLHLADGALAGQDVFHCHLHLIPRYRDDGFGFRLPAGFGKASRAVLEANAARIRAALEA